MIICNDYLGVQRFDYGCADSEKPRRSGDGPGVDGSGRRSVDHRNRLRPGKGSWTYTGSPGEVMQGPFQRATVVRARGKLGINPTFYENAISTFTCRVRRNAERCPARSRRTALLPALTGKSGARADVQAMTGEITLRVLPILAAWKENPLAAAHRGGIKTVLIHSKINGSGGNSGQRQVGFRTVHPGEAQ